MRILLVAYEVPPSPSPRALRWAYLLRELAERGHELHVLAPRLAGSERDLPSLPQSVRIHRTFAGPLMGLVQRRFAQRSRKGLAGDGPGEPPPGHGTGLNWKGRLVEGIKRLANLFLFPDIRAEWNPWARAELRRILRAAVPDMVIVSHEPASTLQLGLLAGRLGFPWIADLGDPIEAPYTPSRWRRRAARLERRVCAEASHLIVTTRSAREQLVFRHGLEAKRCTVLTQGFEDRDARCVEPCLDFDVDVLELFYAGRFYPFRRPDTLLHALVQSTGVRLTIVTPEVPESCRDMARRYPDKVRVIPALPHDQVLALQRCADVLVNFGNEGMATQIPGKLYEYLGARRPILHLLASSDDPAAAFFDAISVGWTCHNDEPSIARRIETMRRAKLNDTLTVGLRPGTGRVAEFGWSRIGERLDELLQQLLRARTPTAAPESMRNPI